MSDNPVQPDDKLSSREEVEQLRPHEGLTAAEFDKLRENNQPSSFNDWSDEKEAPALEDKETDGESTGPE